MWRSAALAIPDGAIQAVALDALARKRGNTHGAAFFAVLPNARSPALLRLLVAYQVLWDFLDSVTEAEQRLHDNDVRGLHRALVDAVDPMHPPAGQYGTHALVAAEGYLAELVATCRDCCQALPSFGAVAEIVRGEARRVDIQAINHGNTGAGKKARLRAWVGREYPGPQEARWFELAAAAGANLAIYALLALAAERCSPEEVAATYSAYFPSAGALATMLDSFVDQLDDRLHGDHCYVSYYGTPQDAEQQICGLLHRNFAAKSPLRDIERHRLVAAAMVAMYLSHANARSSPLRDGTRQIARAGGHLTRALLPVLRLWRIASHSRAT